MEKMNKKGFVISLGLILLVLGILIVLILGLGILFSNTFKLYAIGTAVIIVTLIFGFKGEGLNKQKSGVMIIGILIGTGLILYPSLGTLQTSFAGTPEVYYPQYGNIKCSLASADYLLYEKKAISSSEAITCGVGMNAYTDNCKFSIKINSDSWLANNNFFGLCSNAANIYKCNSAGNCVEISGSQITNDYQQWYQVNLDSNRDGYIDTSDGDVYSSFKIIPYRSTFCKYTIDVKATGNAYVLEDTQGNNYVTTYSQGCDLNDINSAFHETKTETRLNFQNSASQVAFGRSINYVWGMNKGITSNVIQKNGKWIYIQNAGSYSPILTTPDGYDYVDWQTVIPDASIQCVPSNIFTCNADATIKQTASQNVEGSDCSLIRGVSPNDFLKSSNGQCCKFNCVNNKIVVSSCETCKVCESGLIYNTQTNTCVNPTDTSLPIADKAVCSWYQEYKTKETVSYNWYDVLKLNPKVTDDSGCQTSSIFVYIIIGIAVIITLVVLILYYFPKKKTRNVRRKR